MRCITCHPSRSVGLAVLAVMMLSVTLPVAAQWKWRDPSGRVTVSDTPPPRDVPDKDILQRPTAAPRPNAPAAAAASAVAAAASAAPSAPAGDKDLQARKRAADQQAQDKARAEEQRLAAVRAENCQRARQHLATLDSGVRLARVNEKGEREVMDDKARADEARRAREVIASDCR